jgi:hypothetical protein
MQGLVKMVAEAYLSTLSKPFLGERSRWANFADLTHCNFYKLIILSHDFDLEQINNQTQYYL